MNTEIKAESGRRKPERSRYRAPRGTRALASALSALRSPLSAFFSPLSALALLLLPLLARAASDPTLFPDGRQRAEVRPNERNPFAQQIKVEEAPANPQEGASEEARLRRIFRAMKVGGVSGGGNQKHVLLGSLIIKPGMVLPPILKNQSEMLRVLSVGDGSVVLAFVEKDPAISARQIALPIGIQPEVTQMMFGEAFENLTKIGPSGRIEAPPLTIQGAEDFLQGSREANLRNMADRDVQLMGVITDADKPTKGK